MLATIRCCHQRRDRVEALEVKDVLTMRRTCMDAEHVRMNLGAPDRASLGSGQVRPFESVQAPSLGRFARSGWIAAATCFER